MEQKQQELKTFVIDTNVFIHKPDAVLSFKDNEVVVPLWVLEELDSLKTYSDERGRNARHAIRFLDEIGKRGDIHRGVRLENGSILKVALSHSQDIPTDMLKDSVDNKIILTALSLHRQGKKVFFVSKDINARVKATALGLKAVDYAKQTVDFHSLYSGFREQVVSQGVIGEILSIGNVTWQEELRPNEFVILREKESDISILGRWKPDLDRLCLAGKGFESASGIRPLNDQQTMAMELLLDPTVSLVSLVGKAGTGKTLLAIASGLKSVIEDEAYSRVLVTRPVIPMGKDIGFLPGDKAEKLSHWMQPLFHNLDYILSVYKRSNIKCADSLISNRLIEIEALTYIRGRSLPNQYIIIDEAQNLSPHEIKTIVSRAGEGSKVILTGDPYQIDSPYLDSNSNGLTYLVEAFKGQKLFGHVTLQKSERSELAELAAELL
jgi:PhoH-like ATPase